jgi:selenide, water dikinase
MYIYKYMYIIFIPIQVLKHASMRCGGCGAKVGATVLSNVMRRLREEVPMADATKNKVLVGLDAPDDCAVVAPGVFIFYF